MDWNPARIWPTAIGLALTVVSVAGLWSFDLNDPTFTNLRAHSQGIGNWIGLPGALIGGSLVEIFGSASLLAPLLILNWVAGREERPSIFAYLGWSVFLMAAVAAVHGLLRPSLLPGVNDPGLAGWSARYWMAATTGSWAGGAMCGFIALFAANRLAFHPALRNAQWTIGAALLFLLAGVRNGWRQVRQNLHSAAAPPPAGRSFWSLPAMLADALMFWRGSSLSRIKAHRALEEPDLSGAPFPAPAGEAESPPGDEFDSWLASMGAASGPKTPQGPEDDHPRQQPPGGHGGHGALNAGQPPSGERGVEGSRGSRQTPHPGKSGGGVDDADAYEGKMRGMAGPVSQAPDEGNAEPEISESGHGGSMLEEAEAALHEDGAEVKGEGLHFTGETDFAFEQPEAETAWRERFQRYARNLDLDWEDQVWGGSEQGGEEEDLPPEQAEEDPA